MIEHPCEPLLGWRGSGWRKVDTDISVFSPLSKREGWGDWAALCCQTTLALRECYWYWCEKECSNGVTLNVLIILRTTLCGSYSYLPQRFIKFFLSSVGWSCALQYVFTDLGVCYRAWSRVLFNLSHFWFFDEVLKVLCWLRWACYLVFCVHLHMLFIVAQESVTEVAKSCDMCSGFRPRVHVIFPEVTDWKHKYIWEALR